MGSVQIRSSHCLILKFNMSDTEKDIIQEFEDSIGQDVPTATSITQHLKLRRKKMKHMIEREKSNQQSEDLAIRQESLDESSFQLYIEKYKWRKEKFLHTVEQEDTIRQYEDTIREREDYRRKIEDERRRLEDERRAAEDQRRVLENERREREDIIRQKELTADKEFEKEMEKYESLKQVYIIRKQSFEEKKLILKRLQEEELRLRRLEDVLLNMGVEDITLFKALENKIAKGASKLDDETLVFELMGGGVFSDEVKDDPPETFPMQDERYQVDGEPSPLKKSLDNMNQIQDTEAMDIKSIDIEDNMLGDKELEWVFMDRHNDNGEEEMKRFSIDKLFSFFRRSEPQAEQPKRIQEEGESKSLTLEFRKLRSANLKENEASYNTQIDKIKENFPNSTDDKPNLLEMFSSIVISNKDTWSTCSQCDQYFGKLTIKLKCKLCSSYVCKQCGLKDIQFNPSLILDVKSKPLVTSSCGKCNKMIGRITRKSQILRSHNPERFKVKMEKYNQMIHVKEYIDKLIKEIEEKGPNGMKENKALIEKYMVSMKNMGMIISNFKKEIAMLAKHLKDVGINESMELILLRTIVKTYTEYMFTHKKYVYAFQAMEMEERERQEGIEEEKRD